MSYETTTPNIGLPQWVYTDKPQMADFNTAFSKIDTTTGGKLDANNYAHLSTPLTTGTAEAFLLALDPPLTAYVPGMLLVVNFHAEFFPGALIGGEFCTLDVNGLGAKPIYFTNSSFAGSVSAGPHPVMYTDYGNGRWILLDQFLSVGGGQLKGSIYPSGELVRIGTSSNPFQDVYADTVHGSNGAFTNLMVSSQSVWSNAGITSQTVTISGGSTSNSYTLTLYKIGRLVIVNAAAWMDFGTIAANTVIGTLPSGWRPAADTYGAFVDPLHNATIKFLANGNVSTNSDTSVQYCGFLCGTAYMTP